MKTIQYECRPGQIRSRVYDVILFYNDENWDVIKNTFSLHGESELYTNEKNWLNLKNLPNSNPLSK